MILASDVFRSAASIETLLFGSLLVIDTGDLILAGIASALVLAATFVLGPRWLATGFDPDGARAIGLRSSAPDLVLLGLAAVATIAALAAVGALLASALIVVPAATVRLWTRGSCHGRSARSPSRRSRGSAASGSRSRPTPRRDRRSP